MALKTEPYEQDNKWYIDVDPNDKDYMVANVSKDLSDRATTAASVTCLTNGVKVLLGPEVQGNLMVAMVQMDMSVTPTLPRSLTFRVVCVSTAQFDRTIYFNIEDH